ncbi:MAG: VanW family protein [Oscillospiraceae bacterium]|nr:VanW family protein [Oscillospiraceae bacterium]
MLLIAIIAACAIMFSSTEDDGLILNNVYAAGVNLGGKTPEEAKAILQEAVGNTYSKLDMVVEVHDSRITLKPADTGARLDIDAVVEAAYNYGRTGSRSERQKAKIQSLTSSYAISVIPYLNLDTDYIQDAVDELGNKYSSTLSQPKYQVKGERPDLNIDPSQINTETVYQKLVITIGTPEYSLHTGKLYEQILEAYNTNLFEVVGEISVRTPEKLDLDAIYQELCIAPIDAVLDEFTYEVTPEKYGYGFKLEEARPQLESAEYGKVLEIPMCFLAPDLTEEELTDGLFETILAVHKTPLPVEKEIVINLKLACRAIKGQHGGLILKTGEEFSFNDIVGMPLESDGYKPASVYVGTSVKEVVGGGISQVASTLYYCALMADLEILERNSHSYAPNFIETGLDADVLYGEKDLIFKNTTGRPIRIEADVTDDGQMEIRIWGTANKDYSVEIIYETVETYEPETLINTMIPDNPEEYVDGDILVQPITGYDVCTYKTYRYSDPSIQPVKKLIAKTHYDKLDKVVIEIEDPATSDPKEPTDPSAPTDPSESTNPSLPAKPDKNNHK